jgi:hypothetical protein
MLGRHAVGNDTKGLTRCAPRGRLDAQDRAVGSVVLGDQILR